MGFPTTESHCFATGRDGIERCNQCGVTRKKKGLIIPITAPCLVATPEHSKKEWRRLNAEEQYVTPAEELVTRILFEEQKKLEGLLQLPCLTHSTTPPVRITTQAMRYTPPQA